MYAYSYLYCYYGGDIMMPLHGANIQGTYAAYDVALPKEEIIDFSTNTNCIALTPALQKYWSELTQDIDCICQYPGAEHGQLIEAIAQMHQLSQERLLLVNGTNEAIYLLASLLSKKRVGIIEPTYPEYECALKAYNAHVVHIQYEDFCNDALDYSQVDALILCNPNNPTGQYLSYGDLEEKVEQMQAHGVLCIMDEAYMDFLPLKTDTIHAQTKQWAEKYRHVLFLRSLTKIFRIPGIRLGYVMAHPEYIKSLEKRQPSWSVNRLAIALGIRLMVEQDYIQETKNYYHKERERVTQQLVDQGWKVLFSTVNFFVVEVSRADDLIVWCLRHGVVLRHTKNHKGLDGKYIRIGLQRPKENDRLLEVLKAYRHQE